MSAAPAAYGQFDSPLDAALAWGNILLHRKWQQKGRWRWHDVEEARQDLATTIIAAMPRWDPERGKVTTFVNQVFRTWLTWTHPASFMGGLRLRMEHDVLVDPIEGGTREGGESVLSELEQAAESARERTLAATGSAMWSDTALALIDKFPEGVRESVVAHWGEGMSLQIAARHLGVTERTISRHIATARAYIADHPDEFALVA